EELAVVLASGAGGELEAARRLREGFPTAALVEFSAAGPWSGLDAHHTRLSRMIRPRDLRAYSP
ncbi:MAG: histidine phosphatase family protein, partial [Acetobacteraceae bacterium]